MPMEAEVLIAYPSSAGAPGEGHIPYSKILKGFLWPACLSSSLSLSEESTWMGRTLLLCHMWVAQLSLVISWSSLAFTCLRLACEFLGVWGLRYLKRAESPRARAENIGLVPATQFPLGCVVSVCAFHRPPFVPLPPHLCFAECF